MLNHATRYNWHAYQDGLRPSVLGRAAGRGTHALWNKRVEDEDDVDGAVPSRATHEQMQAYVVARHGGDEWGQHDALNKIAQLWRADNAAGGVPVHAHMPLPKEFAKTLAQLMSEMGETQQQQEFDSVVTKLEPSVRTLTAQQLAGLMERNPRVVGDHTTQHEGFGVLPGNQESEGAVHSTPQRAQESRMKEALAKLLERFNPEHSDGMREGPASNLLEERRPLGGDFSQRPPADMNDAHERPGAGAVWRTMEYDEARDGPARWQPLPWDRQGGTPQALQGPSPTQAQRTPDPYAGGEAPWTPMPSAPGVGGPIVRRRVPSFPRPKPVLIPGQPNGYQPGDWYNDAGSRTLLGKVLIPVSELSPIQQANIRRRRWLHPTGQTHRNRTLTQGMGYFGAWRREGGRVTHHGGVDCPGTAVRMPTDADLIEVREMKGVYTQGPYAGQTYSKGYVLVFDLGDGLQLALLHVRPNDRILALKEQLEGRARYSRPLRIRMGEDLGEVDTAAYRGRNDHTHMQIIAEGGEYNGQRVPGFAIDPTPLIERDGEAVRQLEDSGADDDGLWEYFQRLLRQSGLI